MINFIKKAKIVTYISFIIHLFLFSALGYKAIKNFGFDWIYILVSIIPPCIFFYQNIKRQNNTTKHLKK